MVAFLVGFASVCYSRSHNEVLVIVQQILVSYSATTKVTQCCWEFLHTRHTSLTLRHAEPLSYAQIAANNQLSSTGSDILIFFFLKTPYYYNYVERGQLFTVCHCTGKINTQLITRYYSYQPVTPVWVSHTICISCYTSSADLGDL